MSDALARFWAKVQVTSSGCWLWTGTLSAKGYGRFRPNGNMNRRVMAHRFAYEILVGLIPEGKQLDHKCRNRACVNPDHLEVVTNHENILRGETGQYLKNRTHCPHGHPYDEINTYVFPNGRRSCRICRRMYVRNFRERRREIMNAS